MLFGAMAHTPVSRFGFLMDRRQQFLKIVVTKLLNFKPLFTSVFSLRAEKFLNQDGSVYGYTMRNR